MAEEKKTERVTMIWPSELKEQVRQRVGARGLTGFVLEATEAKLGTHDVHKADSRELGEVRNLAQRLADTLVRAGDYEDPVEQLQEIGLPSWIDTTGWPEELANLVPVEDSRLLINNPDLIAASEPAPAPVLDDEDLHRPMVLTKPKPKDLPHDRQTDNLLDRVMNRGKELGIPIEDAGLRPASDLPKPAPQVQMSQAETIVDHPTEPAPDLEVQPEAPTAVAEMGVCPNCKSPLIDGDECWECF